MNSIKIPSGAYAGKTATQLFKVDKFPMLESTGGAGELLTTEIRHQLGLSKTDNFSYKILPSSMGDDYYEIYVSDSYTLSKKTRLQSEIAKIEVTGYIYRINNDGTSQLIKRGTTQTISTYSNDKGQEKIDVYGKQDGSKDIINKQNNTPYVW